MPVDELDGRSFDFASRDEAAKGSAQDDGLDGRGLGVEEILAAAGFELREGGGPGGGDGARIVAAGEGGHGFGVGDEVGGFVELELGGVEVVEG